MMEGRRFGSGRRAQRGQAEHPAGATASPEHAVPASEDTGHHAGGCNRLPLSPCGAGAPRRGPTRRAAPSTRRCLCQHRGHAVGADAGRGADRRRAHPAGRGCCCRLSGHPWRCVDGSRGTRRAPAGRPNPHGMGPHRGGRASLGRAQSPARRPVRGGCPSAGSACAVRAAAAATIMGVVRHGDVYGHGTEESRVMRRVDACLFDKGATRQ